MELLTQIWQSIGTPLTILMWGYIVFVAIGAAIAIGGIVAVLIVTLKDRKKFRRNF